MAKVLKEYFGEVLSSDIHPHGYGEVRDFLNSYEPNFADWVITNPPFRLGEQFVAEALQVARVGVAVLVRTVFLESVGRYKNLFSVKPPAKFAQFVERVPMVKGRLDKSATTATGYAWLTWEKSRPTSPPELVWIPPCRKALERDGDYERPIINSDRASIISRSPAPRELTFL
jgi:hypothetical protein